jgi:uncharacterized repeat protein (TIGR01451 family)
MNSGVRRADGAGRARKRFFRWSRSVLAAGSAAAIALTSLFFGAVPSSAAPGDPFPATDPTVFIAQDIDPTRLYVAQQGHETPIPQGSTGGFAYNAIGFNTVDRYLYGIRRQTANQTSNNLLTQLVRIGQGGQVVSLGQVANLLLAPANNPVNYNQGTFGEGTTLYVRRATQDNRLFAIDVAAANLTAIEITLSRPVPNTSDIVYLEGFLWGFHSDGNAYRINPANGQVDVFAHGFGWNGPTWAFGAQWVYGNGNIGLSRNSNGNIYQVHIADSTTPNPGFTLVSTAKGPASSNNDGASIPGAEVDLGLEKSGPATYVPGGTINYTLTVTNHGVGHSSGFVVTDTLPAGITNPTTSTEGCEFTGQNLSCVFSELAVNASKTIQVSGVAASDATQPIVNTASVQGNEKDPNSDNDSDTHTVAPLLSASLSLVKTVTGDFELGATITYDFRVTNTGNTTVSNLEIAEVAFSGEGSMSAIDCPVTTLAAGAHTNCTATYTLEQEDIDAGVVTNTAKATGDGPGGTPVESPEDDARLPGTQGPELALQKSAAPAQASTAGTTIHYTFVVTNTGNVTIEDVRVDEESFNGHGSLSAVDCSATTLAPNQSTSCQASYTVTQADVDAGEPLKNVAKAAGTPPVGPETASPPDDATVTLSQTPAITVEKNADLSEITAAGQTVAYSFLVRNTGNVTLTDVAVNDRPADFNGAGTLSPITCPVTTLAPNQSTTCEASYVVQPADLSLSQLTNTATATGTPPTGSRPVSPPATENVPVRSLLPGISLSKDYTVIEDANGNGLNDSGDVIRWTFSVRNTGDVALTEVTVDDPLLAGSNVEITCKATELAPDESTTCESAPYTITVQDALSGSIRNVATATGKVPPQTPGDPDDPTATDEVTVEIEPLEAAMSLLKTARLNDANGNGKADAGETIGYTFTLTNTGSAPLSDIRVDDPMLQEAGITVTCPATTLEPAAELECKAEADYVVTAADVAAGSVLNVATGHGTPPAGVEDLVPPTGRAEVPTAEKTAPTDPQPRPPAQPHLPDTGGGLGMDVIALGAFLALVGGGLLALRRRWSLQDKG